VRSIYRQNFNVNFWNEVIRILMIWTPFCGWTYSRDLIPKEFESRESKSKLEYILEERDSRQSPTLKMSMQL
jgi:hypothetical protein